MSVTWWQRLIRRKRDLQATIRPSWKPRRFSPALEYLESRLAPNAHTWTGNSTTSSNWSDANNWMGGAPAVGETNVTLTFAAITNPTRLTNSNDISGLTIQSITFTTNGYTITGQGISLQSGGTTVDPTVSSGTNTFSLNIALTQAAAITTTTAGTTLALGGTLANGGFLLTVAGAGATNFTNIISGGGGLTKIGTGTLGLSGANSYGGATTISAGTIQLNAVNALPSTGTVALAAVATLNLNGNNTTIGSLSGVTGASVLLGNGTLTTGGDNTATTFSGIITGAGGLTKAGSSTFMLGGANTYMGATTINSGTLQAAIANTVPSGSAVTVAAGATLDLNNFDDAIGSLTGAGNVTLGTAAGGMLTTGGNNTNTTFSGAISGTGSLTKAGTGIFTLAGQNTYGGATTINAGTLQAGAGNSLPSNSTVTVAASATLDVNNQTATIGSLAGVANSNVTLGTGTLITGGNNAASTTFAGVITGTGGIVKTGTGIFILSGANTYGGATSINGGTLQVGVANALPSASAVAIASGATLNLTNFSTTIAALTGTGTVSLGTATLSLGGSGTSTFNGVITGAGGLTKIGTGTFVLGGMSTYGGATIINAGTLQMGVDNALPANTALSVTAGATLDLNNRNLAIGTLAGVGNVTLGSGTLTVGGNNLASTFNGVISGSGGLTKVGTGTLTLANFNTYTGATMINAGTLQMGATNALAGTAVTVAAAATFDLNSFSTTIGSLAGVTGSFVTLLSATLTAGGNNTGTTFGGIISGTGSLTKTGTGTLTLTGNNNYVGTTLISSGTLTINGMQATSAVTVSSGATLNGTGTTGPVTAFGTVSPGVSGPGILNTGNAVLSTSFVVALNGITAGTGYSQLNVTGTVSLSGIPNLIVSVGFSSVVGDTFMIIVSTGNITGTFNALPDNATFVANGMAFRIKYNTNNVVLTRVALPATQTAVTSSANPSVFGQPVTFTATVTVVGGMGTPTGQVTFRDGSTALGTGNLTGGVAMFTTTTPLSVGQHTITAVYGGDSSFSGSTGTLTPAQTVNQAATTTMLGSMPNPSTPGQNVTFTATVSATAPGSGTPTGTVTFRDGTTPLGAPVMLDARGVATFMTTSLSLGQHMITAVYSGDPSFQGNTSNVLTQTVGTQTATTTALISSANPSAPGQNVTFTATVTPTAGMGIPTGTVTFRDGTTTLGSPVTLDARGMATFSTTTLSLGQHMITAVYSGDANFATSTSMTLTQTVTNLTTTTTILISSANPSAPGQNVTFTATVTPTTGTGTPTGTVTFRDGTTTLGSPVTLDARGMATFSTTTLSLGQHMITAVYSGDANFAGSTSQVLTQTVANLTTTTTIVSSSANPSAFGQSITFTATVMSSGSGTPTGTVMFRDGNNVLMTAPLSSGIATFTTSALTLGAHTITAVYGGDTSFAGSTSGPLTQTVNQAATATTVVSSVNPATPGQAVTFTATVTITAPGSGTPTGTVTFRDGSTTLGTGSLAGGQATFTTSSLSVGAHTITAVYGGDSNFSGSTSAALTQTVNQAAMPANRRLVGQFYQDLLGRAGDPAGLDFFSGLLDRNAMTRTQVALTIVTSLEGRQKQVQDTYSSLLGRAAEPAGLNHWVAFLMNGGALAKMRALFVSSPEYFQHAGGTNSGFVDALFRDVMNRNVDPAARAATIAALDSANGRRRDTFRHQVVDMIFAGDEPRQAVVQGFYQKFLGRAADGAGLDTFTNLLRIGRDELVILTLVASDEYLSRIPS